MDYIYVGKYVNTHGLKGEIRVISNFAYKNIVFQKGFTAYRKHKIYDMLTFVGVDKIEDIEAYKGMDVFIKRNSLKIDKLFDEDYIGLDVYTNRYIGKVYTIQKGKYQDLFVVKDADKKILIPKVDDLIEKVSLKDNKIWIKEIRGLVDEN